MVESEKGNSQSSFSELVRNSQQRWIEHPGPMLAMDRSHTLPEGFRNWAYQLVLDHLPDYISPEDKQRIRETHPTPIITIGLAEDARYRTASHEGSIDIRPSLPILENITDARGYIQGMIALDEIAVDTLTEDIISSIAQDIRQNGPFGNIGARLVESSSTRRQQYSANMFGEYAVGLLAHRTGQDVTDLRRLLARTAVSGDPTQLHEVLGHMNTMTSDELDISNLGNLAMLLGGRLQLAYNPPAIQTPSRRELVDRAMGHEGLGNLNYPGVIELVAMNKVVPAISLILEAASLGVATHDWRALVFSAINALPSAMAVQSFLGMLYTTIHETSHYLCMDTNRRGLPLVAPTQA